MSKFVYLSIVLFIIYPLSSFPALIDKVKGKKALIHLEGVKTQQGAFFRVYDLNNKKRGLLKIERVAQTKAIGELKIGSMSRKWNLEPVSKRTALVEFQKASKRKRKLALIQKEKMKRRVAKKKALKRRKLLAQQKALKKRRLMAKKKSLNRKVASFTLEEDVLSGLDGFDEGMNQSQEVLSYSNETEDDFHEKPEYPEIENSRVKKNKKSASYFGLGFNLNPQFNYMRIKSINKSPPYDMTGLGGSVYTQFLFSYNSFLEIGANLGYRYFSVSAVEGACPRDGGCSLTIHYPSAKGQLKFNVLNFNQNKIWFLLEGTLMFPLAYLSRIPSLDNSAFDSMSIHGTIGAGLGADFKVGEDWIIPVSLSSELHMPLSQTTLLLTGSLQTGIRYKF